MLEGGKYLLIFYDIFLILLLLLLCILHTLVTSMDGIVKDLKGYDM